MKLIFKFVQAQIRDRPLQLHIILAHSHFDLARQVYPLLLLILLPSSHRHSLSSSLLRTDTNQAGYSRDGS